MSNNNVVDFNERKNKECNHEEVCPHCEFRNSVTSNFISRVNGLDVNSEAFKDEVEDLIGVVEFVTERDTIQRIGISLLDMIDDEDE